MTIVRYSSDCIKTVMRMQPRIDAGCNPRMYCAEWEYPGTPVNHFASESCHPDVEVPRQVSACHSMVLSIVEVLFSDYSRSDLEHPIVTNTASTSSLPPQRWKPSLRINNITSNTVCSLYLIDHISGKDDDSTFGVIHCGSRSTKISLMRKSLRSARSLDDVPQ